MLHILITLGLDIKKSQEFPSLFFNSLIVKKFSFLGHSI